MVFELVDKKEKVDVFVKKIFEIFKNEKGIPESIYNSSPKISKVTTPKLVYPWDLKTINSTIFASDNGKINSDVMFASHISLSVQSKNEYSNNQCDDEKIDVLHKFQKLLDESPSAFGKDSKVDGDSALETAVKSRILYPGTSQKIRENPPKLVQIQDNQQKVLKRPIIQEILNSSEMPGPLEYRPPVTDYTDKIYRDSMELQKAEFHSNQSMSKKPARRLTVPFVTQSSWKTALQKNQMMI